ncbi:MAG: hypothetical protein QXO64_08750 [Thermofilaceae archaeon]
MSIHRLKARIGHIYPIRRRVGHIYPIKRGAHRGGEGEAEGKVAEEREGGS